MSHEEEAKNAMNTAVQVDSPTSIVLTLFAITHALLCLGGHVATLAGAACKIAIDIRAIRNHGIVTIQHKI